MNSFYVTGLAAAAFGLGWNVAGLVLLVCGVCRLAGEMVGTDGDDESPEPAKSSYNRNRSEARWPRS